MAYSSIEDKYLSALTAVQFPDMPVEPAMPEQTMPGNIHNFTIETLLANEWVRQVVHSEDKETLRIIRNTIFAATSEAFIQIKKEGKSIPTKPFWSETSEV